MADAKYPPPNYDAASGVTSSSPCVNEAFELDEGISTLPSAPTFQSIPSERPPFVSFAAMTDEELREACYEYVDETCCYGTRFIRDMILADIYNSYSFLYRLETFTEKRESASTTTSYNGQAIDGPENGPPPEPWDITVRVPTKFKDDYVRVEIPHTAYVTQCHKCNGRGRVTCSSCGGSGSESCSSCCGSGRNSDDESCSSCGGSGSKSCFSCGGSGEVVCSKCRGTGKLKNYRELIVTWRNHVDDFVSDTMRLPPDLIKDVSGREMFKEENIQVEPITHAPDNTVNMASVQLVNSHKRAFPQEQQLMQRHTLWAVPLTRGIYVWKKKQGEFYVYGFQKKVYFENYPQKCCCCTCC